MVIGNIFDDPVNFFKRKRKLSTGIVSMIASLSIFTVLNQVLTQFGIIQFESVTEPLTAIIVNFATLVGGYFLITAVCFITFRIIGGRKVKELFIVTSYSMIPLSLFWIPHILPQIIIFTLSIILMTRGVAIYAKTSNKKAFLVTLTFLILTIVFSLLARNYILLYF